MNLLELSINKFHHSLCTGEASSVNLVKFYLARIERFDSVLASVITVNPQALQEAADADRYFSQTGQFIGPLHGVPVLVKDNVEVKDIATTAGSLSLKSFITSKDADLVRRMREAGAVILAKTNLHEFAVWGESISSMRGQTLNPYDLTRTPGGSSGGTGAALAANFGLVGIGTDTINSIRSPSSANNLVGLRPTVGLVSDNGIVPYSLTQDTAGPMARCVEDVKTVFDIISTKKLKPETNFSKRLGKLKSFFGNEAINSEVNRVMSVTLSQLQKTGYEMVELEDAFEINDLVSNVSVHLYELNRDLNAYLVQNNAPVKSIAEILSSGQYHPGIRDNLEFSLKVASDRDEYMKRLSRREALQQRVQEVFARENLDAIIFPHQQQLVCRTGQSQQQRNGALASITGFPSLCMPAGFSAPSPDAPTGVPIGFELLGLPEGDLKLLAMGREIEAANAKRKPPVEENWL